jgi:hypothetical protein
LRRPRRTWRRTQIILDWKFKSVIDGTVVRLSRWLSRFALPGPVQEVFGLTTPQKVGMSMQPLGVASLPSSWCYYYTHIDKSSIQKVDLPPTHPSPFLVAQPYMTHTLNHL